MSRRGENIYKRKDGRWEGRYIKGRKVDGRIHYGYIYRKSYKETQTALLLAKSQYQQIQTAQGVFSGTCQQWLQYWLDERIQGTVKLSTFASYQHKLKTYIFPLIGDIPLNQLTTNCLQEMIDTWKCSLAATTIQVLYRIIHQGIGAAVDAGNLIVNPCEGIVLPKKESKPVQALSITQQQQLELAAEKSDRGLSVLLALHTGLRMGELAALKWHQIDFEKQLIQVTHTYQRLPLSQGIKKTQLVYSQAKTSSSVRVVPFSAKVKYWLQQQQAKETGPFVLSKNDKPVEPRLLTYHFKRLTKQTKQTIHFHQLRHTFATRCMEAKGDVAAISALLGHSSAKMTLDTYTDALLDQRRAVILAMEEVL